MRSRPLLIVIAAPSGAGKSTLCRRLLGETKGMVYSVSCTTRAPRGEERDGVNYHFLSENEFAARVANGEMLEHAVVHGFRYGTLRRTVEDSMNAGHDVLMDIDVQGARQIREKVRTAPDGDVLKRGFLDIFITVASIDVLRDRLVRRGEDSPQVIETRLANAAAEMACSGEFRHVIVNDDLEEAYARLRGFIAGKKA